MWLIRKRRNCLLLNPGSHKGTAQRPKSHRRSGLSPTAALEPPAEIGNMGGTILPARQGALGWKKANADWGKYLLPGPCRPTVGIRLFFRGTEWGAGQELTKGLPPHSSWTISGIRHIILKFVCDDYSLSSEGLGKTGHFLEASLYSLDKGKVRLERHGGPKAGLYFYPRSG